MQYSAGSSVTENSVIQMELWWVARVGIYLRYSGSSTVTDNTVEHTGGGIRLENSGGSTVSGNIAKQSEGRTYCASGIYLQNSGSSVVSGNTAEVAAPWSTCNGIYVGSSPNTMISGNAATAVGSRGSGGSWAWGIHLAQSENSVISGNTASGYADWGAAGLIIRQSPFVTVERNNLETSGSGIDLDYSEGTTIVQNTASGWWNGIFASHSPSLVVRENIAEARYSRGIGLLSGTQESIIANNTASVTNALGGVGIVAGGDTTIENNIVNVRGYGSGWGVGIIADYDWNIVQNNTVTVISDNPSIGIHMQGNYGTAQDNVVQVNAGTGLRSGSHVSLLRNEVSVTFGNGIVIYGCCNTVTENDITATGYGIQMYATCCQTVSRNEIRGANIGMNLASWSSRHNIIDNVVADGGTGIVIAGNDWAWVYGTLVRGNLFARNQRGMFMGHNVRDHDLYYNCFIENQVQLQRYGRLENIQWDDGAGKGNWWSDYQPGDPLPHQGVDWYPLLEKLCAGNTPPSILSFTATTSEEGSATTFSVEATDAQGGDLTYSYDFDNDGVIDLVTTSNIATNIWGDDHAGTATVWVSDGDLSVEATTDIIVTNAQPQVTITVAEVVEGSPLDVSYRILDSGSDDIFAVLNWGDETTDEREYLLGEVPDPDESTDVNPRDITDSMTHTFGDDTTLEGTLTVTDDDDGVQVVLFTIVVVNGEPEVTTYTLESGNEGDPIAFTATAIDPGADDLDFCWAWDDSSSECRTYPNTDGTFPFTATDSGTHVWGDDAEYDVTLTVTDDDGGYDDITLTAFVANVPPDLSLILDADSYAEGSTALATSSFTDPGTDDVTLSWTWIFGPSKEVTFFNDGMNPDPPKSPGGLRPATGSDSMTHAYTDDGVFGVTVEACDDDGGCATVALPVFVSNVAPTVTISAPASGYLTAIGTPITFSGSFTDPGTSDTHSAQWVIDGTTIDGTVTETAGSGIVEDTIVFTEPGVYQITLMVADDDGGVGSANTVGDLLAMVVIYDPEGGFVTGGGWYWSSPGAYFGDPELEGKVSFGFVAKYHKGADVPKGNTEFRFKAGDLHFHSDSYDWLVIAGARAQFKGTGTINGEGNYGFMLTVIDGDLPGGGGVDRIRMKIWDKETGIMVYDTNAGMDDNTNPLTPLGGGEIKIHEK
ncbi:MAG: right-handed parallel beta-helix repeat-containing protein [Candidatus Thermoplasmatota archaeon]|nr:right-handed parallel beta-helix repeat-containing protein [Candidatus Thermoplasmatota archaeon]